MKKQLVRVLLLCTLAGVVLVHAAAMPLPRWSTATREAVRDGVGNRRDGRAAGIVGSSVPKTGTVRVLVIPVEFAADASLATSGTGKMPYTSWGPAAEPGYLAGRLTELTRYFSAISQNKVTLAINLVAKVTLDKQMASYSNLATGGTAMMTDVIAKADSRINFAAADIVMMVHAGAGREMSYDYDNRQDIHSHYMPLPDASALPTADGVKVGAFLVVPETECHDDLLRLANPNLDLLTYESNPVTPPSNIPHYYDVLGVWAHELCHAFGMADVYDVNYTEGLSLQNWSLMASGSYLPEPPEGAAPWTIPYDPTKPLYGSKPSHPDPWNKQLVGWTTIVNITEPRLAEVIRHREDLGAVTYRMWTNGDAGSNEYFLIENRQQIGYDRYVPENGLMIYHIDESAGSYARNELQIDGTHPRIYPLSADNTLEVDGWGSYVPLRDTAFPYAGNRHVGANTAPSSRDYAGQVTLVDIDAITVSGTNITANLRVTRPVDMIFEAPMEGATIYVTRPTVRAWAAHYDPAGFSVLVNGQPVVPSYNATTGEVLVQLGSPLPLVPGRYTVTITGKPLAQTTSVTSTLTFTVSTRQLPAGLSFISLPGVNLGTTAQVLAGQTPQVAVWDPALLSYRRYPDLATEFASTGSGVIDRETGIPITPAGKGYWVRLAAPAILNLPGDLTNTGRQYSVLLQAGFNMIGTPYHFPVAFNSLLIESGGKRYSISEAAAQHLIEPVLYGWNGAEYTIVSPQNGVLQPWAGYWFLCYQPVNLIFQPMQTSTGLLTTVPSGRAAASDEGWEIALKAQSPTLPYKAEVRVGVRTGATRGVDAGRDVLAPPPAPSGLGLVSRATQPLWCDYRDDNTNQRWELQVSGQPGTSVIVSWPDLLRLPRNYQLTLCDPVTGTERFLRTTASYTVQLGAEESTRTLYLVASPTVVGDLRIGNLAAHRTRAAGSVTISGALSQAARLTVEIRTMTGRLVRRLPEASRAQGAFALTWDGRDADGHALPKGMYQCQVLATAADGKAVKALTVLPQ